jgi:predicted PurR-regulated permease PerM
MAGWINRSEGVVNGVWRLLWRLAVVGMLLYACYRLRNIFTTLLVAAIIAYVLDPLVEWLVKRTFFVQAHAAIANVANGIKATFTRRPVAHVKTPKKHALRAYATLYVFVLSVVVLWQVTQLVVTPFVEEFRSVTAKDPITHKSPFQELTERALQRYDDAVPESMRSDKVFGKIQKSSIGERLMEPGQEVLRRVAESLKSIVEIVLLPVLAFYFLIDGRTLKHEFVALVRRPYLRDTLLLLREFNRIMRDFVYGQFILCVLAGAVVWLGLAALGVKYPITMGVLAGITRAIPIIGPILGGIPIILLTLVTKGTTTALAVLGFFTLLHLVESKFIMPMLIGDRMELHPIIIILVLLIGGEIGGILIGGQLGALLGMFFAAPVASLVRIIIRRYWLRLRLRSEPPSRPASAIAAPVERAHGVVKAAE